MKAGDKIYYLDYEKTGVTYTILSTKVVKNDKTMQDGNYYMVTIDNSKDLKTYPIKTSHVDVSDGKYFSTPEKAHDAFEKYRKKLAQMKIKSRY